MKRDTKLSNDDDDDGDGYNMGRESLLGKLDNQNVATNWR